jgi:DEAD/DEAH box helicase domain-containing protein
LDDTPIEAASYIDLDQTLSSLRAVSDGAELTIHEMQEAAGEYGDFESLGVAIPKELRKGVTERLGVSLERLYGHQMEALGHALKGKNVVLQTPTASGKSLCYLLPVFNKLLSHRNATALFVFPTKALAFDQRKKVAQISEGFDEQTLTHNRFTWPLHFGSETVYMGAYERETEKVDQTQVKERARLVLTNPDSLHMKILPWFSTSTGSWERFLRHLSFVVFDEIHTYRGLFGANVAYVIRRLRMICERLGAKPQFFCSSATLPDPQAHAEQLVGLPFSAVTQSGAPRHRKAFVLWNPGLQKRKKAAEEGARREPTTDAIELVSKVLLQKPNPVQTITFVRALAGVERFNNTLRTRLRAENNDCAEKTKTYKSTILMARRNEIAEGLISGQVVHVTSTNALELGIDIGDLNACLLIGYPGTVSSLLQQIGRVGRKGPSLAVLLLKDEPLEQWFARNPEQFFSHIEKVEPIRLPIFNPHVIAHQLKCAAWDLNPLRDKKVLGGLTPDLVIKYFGTEAIRTTAELLKNEKIEPPGLRGGGKAYWVVRESYNDVYQNIRVPISTGKFKVIDESGRPVGECDSSIVPRDLFPGAIWINEGNAYQSKKIHYSDQRVEVNTLQDRIDYYTSAMPQTRIDCEEETAQIRSSDGCTLGRGLVRVHREVKLYREIAVGSEAGEKDVVKPTKTRPIEYDSTAFWLEVSEELLSGAKIKRVDAFAAIHALEHSLRSVFPLLADVDPGDLGSSLAISKPGDPDFQCRLYLFDNYAGGTGLSEFAFGQLRNLLDAADDLLASCKCKAEEGCPRCTIISWCEYQNRDISKKGARKLLRAMRDVE